MTLRIALRTLAKQPFFTGAILFMLALGIGSTTAIFSVVQGVLLKPLPFPDTDRMVEVWGTLPARNIDQTSFTEANFWDMRDLNGTFQEFGAWHGASFSLTGTGTPERLDGALVSVGFLRALGVRPVAGQLFAPGEDEAGADPRRVLLAHRFWSTHFGTDTSIVGRTLTLDGYPYTVVGILPAASNWLNDVDVFVPFMRRANADRGSWEYQVVGKIKPGISRETANADLVRVAKSLEQQYKENAGLGVMTVPAATWVASDYLRRTLWILLGAVGLLLVIACVNVTNLLLARASTRVRESAVRSALGATRADLLRERLAESLMLGGAGAVLGWMVAAGMLQILKVSGPSGIRRLEDVSLNLEVLAFTVVVAVLVGVVTGIVPALQMPAHHITGILQHGQRGTTGDRRHDRLRAAFVAAEVAISIVLLVGAGLLTRSLSKVLANERGFESAQRVFVTVSIPEAYPETRREELARTILAGLERRPEIVSVAVISGRPLSRRSTGMGIAPADRSMSDSEVPWASWRIITRDYFRAMGMTLLAGREFTEQDIIAKPWRVVISQRLARVLWPDGNAVGRTADLWRGQNGRPAEVIGVVSDIRERGLEGDPTFAVYIPAYGTLGDTSIPLVMHARGTTDTAVAAAREVVQGVDASLPVSDVRSFEDVVSASVATRRFTMLLLVTFSSLAFVLALAGVYGVLAYSLARRTSEMGVRLALGAQRGSLVLFAIARGMTPVAIGGVVGLVGATWLSRFIASLLFGVTTGDVPTYAIAATAVLATSLVACYIPARAVLRIDPVAALRSE
jgi:putative ABC transport system permease protein